MNLSIVISTFNNVHATPEDILLTGGKTLLYLYIYQNMKSKHLMSIDLIISKNI